MKHLSKGRILLSLLGKLRHFKIPTLEVFDKENYNQNKKLILKNIKKNFSNKKLIIRSSAVDEDHESSSMAGKYLSIQNINSNNLKEIESAIDKVFKSYKSDLDKENEIIIQEMIFDVGMSGVIFTHDLNNGAPYYVINYDDISGLTDSVTSGGEYSNRTLCVHRNGVKHLRSTRFNFLIKSVKELELVIGSDFLDVEFAIDQNENAYLFQVRSISTQKNWNRGITQKVDQTINEIKHYVKSRLKPLTNIFGRTTIYGQMPDWNPVEMLGRVPKPLGSSLYKKMITNKNWQIARQMMGYRNFDYHPLMISLAGQSYIDTRLSFNSFLPTKLSKVTCNKLVNFWIDKLSKNPHLHDKIEFEIAITCFSFDIERKLEEIPKNLLSKDEIKLFVNSTKLHFKQLIDNQYKGSIKKALDKINVLEKKQKQWKRYNNKKLLNSFFPMLEYCQEYGTIPFAILARHGFIAQTILRSLVEMKVINETDLLKFISSIKTVASDLVEDIKKLQDKKISLSTFLNKFGHLRPNTYDISSKRYDQMDDFFYSYKASKKLNIKNSFKFNKTTEQKINHLLNIHGFKNINSVKLIKYIKDAIIGREYGKFTFTKTLSDILEILSRYGESYGLSKEELSYIPIDEILSSMNDIGSYSVETKLRNIYKTELEKYNVNLAIRLPQVIFDQAGTQVIPFQVSMPNFITKNKINAETCFLNLNSINVKLDRKIVLIENADPGFDWIFSKNIAGLITKYGGANSHMAIRCAEFDIPAAIGCGEQRFELLLNSTSIYLDCSAGNISSI